MVYKYREGSRYSVSAQVAGEICRELEEQDSLTAENLVNISKPEDAPLHKVFCWDDEKAANLFRKQQAMGLIRSIEVVVESEDCEELTSHPVFYNIKMAGHEYKSMETIRCSVELLDALKVQCYEDMQTFVSKYKMVSEIEPIIGLMEEAIESDFANM